MKSTIILASNNEKSFSKEIIEDLQEENKLCSQYTKLLAKKSISDSLIISKILFNKFIF